VNLPDAPAAPPTAAWHPLLQRQLKRLSLAPGGTAAPWPPGLLALLERVSKAYEEHDQERYLLEHSQDLASNEMGQLNAQLRAERDLLDERVRERTGELRTSEGRLQSLLSLSADWIWEQDEELRFCFVSDGIEAATGVAASSLIGECLTHGERLQPDANDAANYQACWAERRPFRDFRFALHHHAGQRRYVRLSGEPVHDDRGRFLGYRGVGRDVTEAALAQRRVLELASLDTLTGLPNRNQFLADLDRALERAQRDGGGFAVAFIDLDRFKTINDTLGHGSGDDLLCTMGRRLRHSLRSEDLVARFGGDEFVVLLRGELREQDLLALGHKLMEAIGQPLTLQGSDFLITGSVGISRFPQDASDAATLLKHADAAMYLAKERGKNNVQFYTAELAERAAHEFALESELRLALARGELLLYYQPKWALTTQRLVGTEALVRWRHPRLGLVPPAEFIPLAEERGLIVALGRWVTQQACRQMRAWREAGFAPPPVAVNLSARQFSSESLVSDVLQAIEQHGLKPGELDVELTESALMSEPERAGVVLRQLQEHGVSVAIDDFGTGYSSLAYLKRFPAAKVKIDRSFIDGLPGDKDDMAITQAIIALAHSLQLRVVAEGVETTGQLDVLRQMGCDEAQGFLLGRPMEAQALQALLQREQAGLAANSPITLG
jgi:diguanylate cyclase (GGDEF)-like protein/PAS domain S-box-containing protein